MEYLYIILAIIIVIVFYMCYSKFNEKFAILPSNYGLSPMNKGVGFVKPFSINVNIPKSLQDVKGMNDLSSESQSQVMSQQSASFISCNLSSKCIR